MMKKILSIVFFAFMALSVSAQRIETGKLYPVKIGTVHDGDSFSAKLQDTLIWVRVLGVDCPEVAFPLIGTTDQPFGRQVADSARVMLHSDSVSIVVVGYDLFGRSLCRVYVGSADFNKLLLSKGYAWYVTSKHFTVSEQRAYKKAERMAKNTKLGLWVDGSPVSPSKWRKGGKRA